MIEETAQRGDSDQALEQMVREHGDAMYRVAVSVVRDHALAEDVTQESLVKAWLALDTFRGEGSLRSWLLRITHNTAVSFLRRQRDDAVDPARMPERADNRAVHQAEAIHLHSTLESALDLLDSTSRTIVVLHDVDGYSYTEIADIVGVSLSVVKSRLFRSRPRLAAALQEVSE